MMAGFDTIATLALLVLVWLVIIRVRDWSNNNRELLITLGIATCTVIVVFNIIANAVYDFFEPFLQWFGLT